MNGALPLLNLCTGLSDTVPSDWPLAVHDDNMDEWLRLFREPLPCADRHALSMKARQYVEKHFSVKRMQREYEDFYLRRQSFP